ncbi:MAG: hypothetical protein J4F33_07295 [Alphaproteobacteria bacterium]|nr:hypothetical protein [Alphaproteobacteria bacterium]
MKLCLMLNRRCREVVIGRQIAGRARPLQEIERDVRVTVPGSNEKRLRPAEPGNGRIGRRRSRRGDWSRSFGFVMMRMKPRIAIQARPTAPVRAANFPPKEALDIRVDGQRGPHVPHLDPWRS